MERIMIIITDEHKRRLAEMARALRIERGVNVSRAEVVRTAIDALYDLEQRAGTERASADTATKAQSNAPS